MNNDFFKDWLKIEAEKEAKIGKDYTKKLNNVKEKKPLVSGIDYKVWKMLVFGYSAEGLAGTKSKQEPIAGEEAGRRQQA